VDLTKTLRNCYLSVFDVYHFFFPYFEGERVKELWCENSDAAILSELGALEKMSILEKVPGNIRILKLPDTIFRITYTF
jgi:hypothetical protein